MIQEGRIFDSTWDLERHVKDLNEGRVVFTTVFYQSKFNDIFFEDGKNHSFSVVLRWSMYRSTLKNNFSGELIAEKSDENLMLGVIADPLRKNFPFVDEYDRA